MPMEIESYGVKQFSGESVEELIGHFEGHLTTLAGHVTVIVANEMVGRRGAAAVGVFDETKML